MRHSIEVASHSKTLHTFVFCKARSADTKAACACTYIYFPHLFFLQGSQRRHQGCLCLHMYIYKNFVSTPLFFARHAAQTPRLPVLARPAGHLDYFPSPLGACHLPPPGVCACVCVCVRVLLSAGCCMAALTLAPVYLEHILPFLKKCVCSIVGLAITVRLHLFGHAFYDFPAKNIVYTPHMYGSGQPYFKCQQGAVCTAGSNLSPIPLRSHQLPFFFAC